MNSYLRPYDDRKLSNSFTENVNGNYVFIWQYLDFNRFKKRVIYSLSKDVHYSLNNSLYSDSVPKRERGTYKKIENEHSKTIPTLNVGFFTFGYSPCSSLRVQRVNASANCVHLAYFFFLLKYPTSAILNCSPNLSSSS